MIVYETVSAINLQLPKPVSYLKRFCDHLPGVKYSNTFKLQKMAKTKQKQITYILCEQVLGPFTRREMAQYLQIETNFKSKSFHERFVDIS